jgi:cytochrome c-type biogenesis protein CcmH/NrfG
MMTILKALELDPGNYKGFYKLGQAFALAEEWELAKTNYYKAAKIEPQNKDIRKEYETAKEKAAEAEALSRMNKPNTFYGMFDKK